MGLTKSKQEIEAEARERVKAQIRAKNKKEIQYMYGMIDESVNIVRNSHLQVSVSSGLSASISSGKGKISNLDDVLEQLLESFKDKGKYIWGLEIYQQFKKHFAGQFEEMWALNKEDFYRIILSNCKFETLDFQKELSEIGQNQQLAVPLRNSFKDFFYEVGAAQLENRLPTSIICEGDFSLDQLLQDATGSHQAFNINAINATIINNEFHPEQYDQSHYEKPDPNDNDFLPLFISPRRQSPKERQMNTEEAELKKRVRQARIQNSSLVMPETVFLSRQTEQVKQEIGDLVSFYRQFGNALQSMMFSVSFLSAPFKHFIFLLTEEMERKNIKRQGKSLRSFPTCSSSLTATQKLLYGENEEAYQFRERRHKNNDLILDEIKDFTEAYTYFVWMYLELNGLTELKLGRLISIEAVYGIVLKAVWAYTDFISMRGYEYEEWKLQQYYSYNDASRKCEMPEEKKRYLLRILKNIKGERSPQRYLKKIVIFYREASTNVTCADELLYIYEYLIVELIKQKLTRQLGLFRMRNVIEKVLKIDEANSGSGQIGYGWISWCITIEYLKSQVSKQRDHKKFEEERVSRIHEPPASSYFQEQ